MTWVPKVTGIWVFLLKSGLKRLFRRSLDPTHPIQLRVDNKGSIFWFAFGWFMEWSIDKIEWYCHWWLFKSQCRPRHGDFESVSLEGKRCYKHWAPNGFILMRKRERLLSAIWGIVLRLQRGPSLKWFQRQQKEFKEEFLCS